MSVKVTTELIEHTCITCGIVFAFPENYDRWLRETHGSFYCPNGHNMYFPAKTEAEELREKLREERHLRKEYQEENIRLNNQLNGTLEKLSKAKRRANAGLCPHCRRHFMNVERHIKTKHPEKIS